MDAFNADLMNQALVLIDKVQMPFSMTQILALIAFFGICFYMGQHKLGMVVSFFTVSYWAFASNKVWILEVANGSFYGMLAAITVGMAVAFIGFVGILQERH